MIGIVASLVSLLKASVATRRRKVIMGLTIAGVAALIIYFWLHGQHPTTTTPPPTGCTSNCGGTTGSGGTTTPPTSGGGSPPPSPNPHPAPAHGNTEFAETRGMGHHTGIEKFEIRNGTEDDALSRYLRQHYEVVLS